MLTITNFSPDAKFSGWVRGSVPAQPGQPKAQIVVDDQERRFLVRYGEQTGMTRSAWVLVKDMKPNSVISLDLANAKEVPPPPHHPMVPEVAKNPVRHFAPTLNGIPLQTIYDHRGVWLRDDGAAVKAHFRGRITRLMWADLWVTWCPDEKWFRWELLLNAASPAHGNVITEHFEDGFTLRMGTATVALYGGQFGAMMEGQSIAQGQARAFAGVGAWLDLCDRDEKKQLFGMLTGSPIAIDSRLKETIAGMGVPEADSGFDSRDFVNRYAGDAYSAMHDWSPVQGLGVSPMSGRTGAQEEQCFGAKGIECFDGGTAGGAAAMIRYLTALTYARRPCHWREEDGRMLDYDAHPQLVFWTAGPHWHHGVSPDRLGLSRLPTQQELHGWSGPDREHWFYGSLFTAALLFGSDLCQWLLEAQARVVWFQETTDPTLTTSSTDAARSIGWFGIMAMDLRNSLRSDDSRGRVMARARDRVEKVYVPALRRTGQWSIWDIRSDARLLQTFRHWFFNVRLETGELLPERVRQLPERAVSWMVDYEFEKAWMPYQQAVGAYGLWLLGMMLGNEDAIAIAQHAADTVTRLAYQQDAQGENGLQTWSVLPLKPGTDDPIDPEDYRDALHPGTVPVTWFRRAWLPLALWVRLQATIEPDALADQWWQLLMAEVGYGETLDWFPPRSRQPHFPQIEGLDG